MKRFNTIQSKFLQNKIQFILIGILLLAAFMRLYRISDYMTFLGDEGRDVLAAYNILHGHPTLLGPTSSVGGFFLGPIYYYLMAPFLFLFNYDPVGPAVMVALFSVATVWLMYKIGSEFFNKTAALTAGLFYAIAPVVISYSHSSWNPNVMPFFSFLTLYLLYQALRKNTIFLLFLVGILFGITMQLHYVAVFLGAILVSYIFIIRLIFYRLKAHKSYFQLIFRLVQDYSLFLFGAFIGLLPFFAFEKRHEFINTRNIYKFIFHSGETGGSPDIIPRIADVFFRLFARLVANFPAPDSLHSFNEGVIVIWVVGIVIFALFSIVLVIKTYKKAFWRSDIKVRQLMLILLWFFIGVCIFGLYKKPIYDYYFTFLFPLPFLLIGNAFSFLQKQKVTGKVVAYTGFCILALINLRTTPFIYQPNRQANQAKEISQFVLDKTDGKPFNFALISGGNSDNAYRYFFKITGRDPITIENLQKDQARKTVTDQLFVVCESLPCSPLGTSEWEIAGFGRGDIAQKWKVSVVEVYKIIHYKGTD